MGLFTNRKKDETADVADDVEAASMLALFSAEAEQGFIAPPVAPPATEPVAPIPGFAIPEPLADVSEMEEIDVAAVSPIEATPMTVGEPTASTPSLVTPFPEPTAVELPSIELPAAELPAAELPAAEALPVRRLEDHPRAQAGNVEINASGLLEMLGVDASATLSEISEAHQRFLSEHRPAEGDDADAAEIKDKIRSEVNGAYASFRLTYAA